MCIRDSLQLQRIVVDQQHLEMTAGMCRQAGVAAECCQYPEYAAKQMCIRDRMEGVQAMQQGVPGAAAAIDVNPEMLQVIRCV